MGCLLLIPGLLFGAAPEPHWIWGGVTADNELRFFRRTLELPAGVRKAVLTVACDDEAVVSMNGQGMGRNESWKQPTSMDVRRSLQPGANQVLIVARNSGLSAGLLARFEATLADGSIQTIVSDERWETSVNGAADWVPATDRGAHGIAPWGLVLKSPTAVAAEALRVAEGFRVELLRSADAGEGSWVSLTFDPKGRMWISPQGSEPLLRMTLRDGRVSAVETVATPVRSAMGLLWAFDSFYVNGRGTNGVALYRLRDRDGDDAFDVCDPIRVWKGEGEHGSHGLASDGKSLFVVNGNGVEVPMDRIPLSPARDVADDVIPPRLEEGRGSGRKAWGGHVLRMNPDGTGAEIFSAGQRNAYDIAFNGDGELFAFDSDHEADWGLPWYRANRILHCFAGADHGYREGSAKRAVELEDAVAPVVEVGLGSPTGLVSGSGTGFSAKYRRALFAGDWSLGRVLAVHLTPKGSSYEGAFETVVQGRPLNVTDLAVGPDGAVYFITGGRGTQSGLYRLTQVLKDAENPGPEDGTRVADRARRRGLDALPGKEGTDALERIWGALGSEDRVLRYAARLALERRPVSEWRDRALAETNAVAGLTALLALTRAGTGADQGPVLKGLTKWPLDGLAEETFLLKLRLIGISFARHGIPDALRSMALSKLERQFPARTAGLNRELSQLLVALGSSEVVGKALALRDAAATQAEAVRYQAVLRMATNGWSRSDRERYFTWFHRRPSAVYSPTVLKWFADTGLKAVNGAAFEGYLRAIRQQAFAALPDDEKGELAPWVTGAAFRESPPVDPVRRRSFVRHWTTADLMDRVGQAGDAKRGKVIWHEAQCAACHRMGGEGGDIGPDLTAVGLRFSRIDLLRSLTEPSAVVSEQYQDTVFSLRNGERVVGRVKAESDGRLTVRVGAVGGQDRVLAVSEVASREPSKVSPMPEGLMDPFTAEEVLDLLAYLQRP